MHQHRTGIRNTTDKTKTNQEMKVALCLHCSVVNNCLYCCWLMCSLTSVFLSVCVCFVLSLPFLLLRFSILLFNFFSAVSFSSLSSSYFIIDNCLLQFLFTMVKHLMSKQQESVNRVIKPSACKICTKILNFVHSQVQV